MLTSRTLILTCLLLIFASAINYFLAEPDVTEPIQSRKNDPDLYMRNASITQYTKTGDRQHRIEANSFTHFPLTDTTTLRTPNMTLYPSENKSKPWDITANHGRLLPKALFRSEIVELWDQVLAVQENGKGEFVNIRTASLTVHPETDYAETNQKVLIDENSGRTTAAGMKAYFEKGYFIFFSNDDERVHTILLPEFNKQAE